MASASEQRWLPLESNPESFNAWSQSLGLDTTRYSFQDCYGLDDELLSWVKGPVKAVILLFPITEPYEIQRKLEDAQIEKEGVPQVEQVIYFKQTIQNACGTFGLLHALANAGVPLEKGYLTDLFERCKDKSPIERAELLTATNELEQVHTNTAQSGQTQTPTLETQVDLHFCTFVEHRGNLIELDGRRNSPINRGKIKKGLLQDTAERVKQIIEISNSYEFNLITLNPTPTE